MLIDIAAHLGRSVSSSLAKNTEANFKISFARRSSMFSFAQLADLLALLAGQTLPPASIGITRHHP